MIEYIIIGILILLRFITRYIYDDCLFLLSNNHLEFDIERDIHKYINWDIVFFISLLIISFRLLKNYYFDNI